MAASRNSKIKAFNEALEVVKIYVSSEGERGDADRLLDKIYKRILKFYGEIEPASPKGS